jgi:hypothetical protein
VTIWGRTNTSLSIGWAALGRATHRRDLDLAEAASRVFYQHYRTCGRARTRSRTDCCGGFELYGDAKSLTRDVKSPFLELRNGICLTSPGDRMQNLIEAMTDYTKVLKLLKNVFGIRRSCSSGLSQGIRYHLLFSIAGLRPSRYTRFNTISVVGSTGGGGT